MSKPSDVDDSGLTKPPALTKAIPLPDEDATPDDVREYLIELLQSGRRFSFSHAEDIASAWKVGSGRELRIYPVSMYLTVFGREHGWILYKDIKTQILSANRGGLASIFLVAFGVALLLSLGLLYAACIVTGPFLTILTTLGASFGVLACVVILVAAVGELGDPVERIEGELATALKSMPPMSHVEPNAEK